MLDLHLHSTFSDGSCTPEELVRKAVEQGVYGIALTDHDTTKGIPVFMQAGAQYGVVTVPGVEISADYAPGTMHILGYYVDPEHGPLNEHLKWIREGREERNREIYEKLKQQGVDIPWSAITAYAGDDVVGRPHFAQALVAAGYARDPKDAFRKFLARGRSAYCERRRLNPALCVQIIVQAGGVPVLAHPSSLAVGGLDLREEVKKLVDAGLQGIEVIYPEHTQEMRKKFRTLAETFDLVVTGGTDFHGALTPDLLIGRGFGNLNVENDVLDRLMQRRKS